MSAVGGPAAKLPSWPDLVIAANRQSVCTRVARWLIHDLRNPTQALTLVTGIMDDESLAGEIRIAETLREATTHVARSLELLDRLLTDGPAGAEPGPVALVESLRFVAALHRARRTAVTLDLDGVSAERLPAVLGIGHELELVLLNLMLNSLEALRDRPAGWIAITASPVGEEVRVTVADDGPGIASELEARIFEPSVSAWTTGGFAGLGLAASRSLAERHGGSLTYAPGGGPGARFELRLRAVV